MGNKPATLGISTDHESYKAGSTMTGTVYLSIQKPLTNNPASSRQTLNLEICGEEHAVIHHRTTEEDHRSTSHNSGNIHRDQDHYEESSFPFFQLQVPLAMVDTSRAGRYEYPFSLTLPTTLPSSMHRQSSGQSYCEIRYHLKATLGRNGGLFSAGPQPQQKEINIMASPTKTQDTGVTAPREYVPVMACCCCCSEGTMMLEAASNRSILAPNQTCTVKFMAKNMSKQKAKRVEVTLMQSLEWNVNGRTEKTRTTLDRHTIDARMLPELKKKRRHQREDYFGAPEEQGLNSTDAGGGGNTHSVDIRVPPNALDTYAGRSVQVRHALLVTIWTKGCCSTNPEARMRCTIASGSIPAPTSMAAQSSSGAAGTIDPLAGSASMSPSASAPPSYMDNEVTFEPPQVPPMASVTPVSYADSLNTPQAHATALPQDWDAQTADVVEIPMAQATLLGPAASTPTETKHVR